MLGSKLNGISSALAPASENLVMLVMLGWKTWPERCASYTAFNCYYSVWKLLLSGAYSRFMPLVVLYGIQGADCDAVQLDYGAFV